MPVLRVRGKADCSHLILAEPPLETDQRAWLLKPGIDSAQRKAMVNRIESASP